MLLRPGRRSRGGAGLSGLAAGAWCLLAATATHAGGAWVPARGLNYVELSTTYASTDLRYDAAGSPAPFERLGPGSPRTTYRDFGLHLYGEAGLGRGFGIEGDVTWRSARALEPATIFRTNGPADARLQLKRGFRAGSILWAVSVEGRFPMGYDAADYPSLGSGHTDAGANLHVGSGNRVGYVTGEIGILKRGGPERDEWPYAVQAGLNLTRTLQLIGDARGHGVFGNISDAAGAGAAFDPQTASSRLTMVGPGAAYAPVSGLRISANAWRSVAGANVPRGWMWKFGVARTR